MTTAWPFLMFQGGTAQAALNLYFDTFPDSHMMRVERYSVRLRATSNERLLFHVQHHGNYLCHDRSELIPD